MARIVEIFVIGSGQPFRCELSDDKITELCDKLPHGAGTIAYEREGRTYVIRVAHITAVTFGDEPGSALPSSTVDNLGERSPVGPFDRP
jgi:hypothetical protein